MYIEAIVGRRSCLSRKQTSEKRRPEGASGASCNAADDGGNVDRLVKQNQNRKSVNFYLRSP